MPFFTIRPKAREDLENIWLYTYETRGEEQADKYIKKIEARFSELANNPNIGKPRNDIRPNYSSYHEGKHVISYRKANNHIEIVRILHERMDPNLHFPPLQSS